MEAMADDDLLAWAAARDYVVVSQDRSTKEASAFARMGDALTMTGLVLVHSDLAIGRAVDDLVFLIETATDADWRGRIHHLPL